MDTSTLILFLAMVGGAVFMLTQLILVPSFGTKSVESRAIRERLKKTTEIGISGEHSLVRQKYLRDLPPFERWLETLPGTESIQELTDQAGKDYRPYAVIVPMFGLGLFAAIVVWYFTASSIMTAWDNLLHKGGSGTMIFIYLLLPFLAAFFFGSLPYLKLKNDRKKRLDLFEEQLPDALDMMTRALRAGYPFNESMHYIAQEMPDPIAKEFGLTFDEINYGQDVRLAFNYLLLRVPSTNLIATVTAILIQRETGGNLAELLDKISDILRKRFRFQRRVKTLTAENRISAWVLSLLPFVVFFIISLQSPEFVKPLFYTDSGNFLLILGLVLQVVGAFWIRKQINFDI
jgi:tight adherence protein B